MSPTSNDVAVVTLKWVWFALNYSTDITHKKFEEKEEEIHLNGKYSGLFFK